MQQRPVANDIQVSDVDSDLDPEEMLVTYLRTKARLFDRNPELVEGTISSSKKGRSRGGAAMHAPKPSPGEAKLQLSVSTLPGPGPLLAELPVLLTCVLCCPSVRLGVSRWLLQLE